MMFDPYSLDDYTQYKESTLLQEAEQERLLRQVRELQVTPTLRKRVWKHIHKFIATVLQRRESQLQQPEMNGQDTSLGIGVKRL